MRKREFELFLEQGLQCIEKYFYEIWNMYCVLTFSDLIFTLEIFGCLLIPFILVVKNIFRVLNLVESWNSFNFYAIMNSLYKLRLSTKNIYHLKSIIGPTWLPTWKWTLDMLPFWKPSFNEWMIVFTSKPPVFYAPL